VCERERESEREMNKRENLGGMGGGSYWTGLEEEKNRTMLMFALF